MPKLFDSISDAARKAKDTVQQTAAQTGGALAEVSSNLGSKVDAWMDAREEKRQEAIASRQRTAEIQSGCYDEDGKTMITTVDGLQTWLRSIEDNISGTSLEIVRSQIQILSVISSPVMVGMTLDRILDSLNKSLKSEPTEEQRLKVRDTYASMIQNLFFFLEAKLRYAMDKNKDEAYQLLGQAGERLSDCCRSLIRIYVSTEKPVAIKNFISTMSEQKDFFNRFTSWIRNKGEIEKKMDEYRKTLQNMFQTFDDYADLIGPSILIHGMLSKYHRVLVDIHKEEIFAPVRKKYNAMTAGKSIKAIGKAFKVESGDSMLANPIGFAIKSASRAVSGVGDVISASVDNNIADMDIFFRRINQLNSDKDKAKLELQKVLAEMETLQKEYEGVGMLQISLKKEMKSRIDTKNDSIKEYKEKISEFDKQLSNLENSFPDAVSVKYEIDAYDAKLASIANKYRLLCS